jgi:hypothetical protein
MFARKLTALDYPSPMQFNVNGKSVNSLVCGPVNETPELDVVCLSHLIFIYLFVKFISIRVVLVCKDIPSTVIETSPNVIINSRNVLTFIYYVRDMFRPSLGRLPVDGRNMSRI